MKRQVQKLHPFEFSSDFQPPAPNDDDQITLSAMELAALLDDARRGAAELVRDETLSLQSEKLERISESMRTALQSIGDLASHLERSSIDEHDRLCALESVRHLARTLVDGQGELFAKGALHSQIGNDSDKL